MTLTVMLPDTCIVRSVYNEDLSIPGRVKTFLKTEKMTPVASWKHRLPFKA